MREFKSFEVPEEITLLEFLEVEPIEANASDGYWCYEINDENGRILRLSFDVFERSLQTSLYIGGEEIVTVSHEGATKLEINSFSGNKILKCEFVSLETKTVLEICLKPKLLVRWGSLLTDRK